MTKQETRRVIKTPAATQERTIPAVTKTVTRRRVVKTPARTAERVQFQRLPSRKHAASSKRLHVQQRKVNPSGYPKQVTRRVVDRPASTQERTIPAVTKMRSRRVIKTPAATQERTIPAITKTVTRRVVKTPAAYNRAYVIPAVTKQVTRRVIKTPAATQERTIPAVTKTVTRRVVKTPASTASSAEFRLSRRRKHVAASKHRLVQLKERSQQ